SLERINDDVLRELCELLRPMRQLRPFSTTSKRIREVCKPILFRRSLVDTPINLCTWEDFVPRQIRPYVQNLIFDGYRMFLVPTEPRPLIQPPPLAGVIAQLPNLTRITIKHNRAGVPLPVLIAMLSLPQLRVFDVEGTVQDDNGESWSPQAFTFAAAPLTRYRQALSHQKLDRPRTGDKDIIAALARKSTFQRSLVTLIIPNEAAPLSELFANSWPRLRHLSFQGGAFYPEQFGPLIHLLDKMPELDELELNVARRQDQPSLTLQVCPSGWMGPFPSSQLRHLTVAYPDPGDPLYSHLPTSLRHIALRCWPRHYIFGDSADHVSLSELGWQSPILPASRMLQLLSRCRCPELQELDVEFMHDYRGIELLRHIGKAFPKLTTLMLHHYYQGRAPDVSEREVGEALSGLKSLQVLYFYLEMRRLSPTYMSQALGVRQLRLRQDTAITLARALAPSVKVICLLQRYGTENKWRSYRVLRPTGDDPDVHVHHDTSCHDEFGVR
ncbi:hypothetical protein BD413DRAFT_484958, partial [Trametes elegans]